MAFPPSEDTHNTNEKLVEKTCTTLSQIIVFSSETSLKDHEDVFHFSMQRSH